MKSLAYLTMHKALDVSHVRARGPPARLWGLLGALLFFPSTSRQIRQPCARSSRYDGGHGELPPDFPAAPRDGNDDPPGRGGRSGNRITRQYCSLE